MMFAAILTELVMCFFLESNIDSKESANNTTLLMKEVNGDMCIKSPKHLQSCMEPRLVGKNAFTNVTKVNTLSMIIISGSDIVRNLSKRPIVPTNNSRKQMNTEKKYTIE